MARDLRSGVPRASLCGPIVNELLAIRRVEAAGQETPEMSEI